MRKGNLFTSDMLWFMIFVMIAAFTYIFLFKDLAASGNARIDTTKLEVDADFIAQSMMRMNVTTKETEYNGKPFADVVQAVIQEYRKNNAEFDESSAFKAYEEFVRSTLSHEAMKQAVKDAKGQDVERRRTISYTMLLQTGSEPIRETCIQENTGATAQTIADSQARIPGSTQEDRRADAALELVESSCDSKFTALRSEHYQNIGYVYIAAEEPITVTLKQTVRVRP